MLLDLIVIVQIIELLLFKMAHNTKQMMKQTAVEWLVEQITNGDISARQAFQQAKAMEKDQIIRAYSEGQNTPYEYSEDNEINWYDGPQYYKETYESKTNI